MQILTVEYTTSQELLVLRLFLALLARDLDDQTTSQDDGLTGSFYLPTTAKYTIDVDAFLPYTLQHEPAGLTAAPEA